jgi:chemotaxis signal transduction protein
MLWYAAEPLAALDANRAISLAEKSKMPKMLNYMIQRVGVINTLESTKILLDLKQRLAKMTTHEHHEDLILIEKFIKK